MSVEAISRLVKALSELGVCKIRLTGGEPTVRKDYFEQDLKVNFPSLAHAKYCFRTQLMPLNYVLI